MTDDIRTRIAAAICTDNPFGWTAYMCEEAADAVIAQLGVAKECSWHVPVSKWVEPLPKKVRYVTDWTADE